ncbi:MAG TPA: TlyA family RNA methyltransferase [Kiritimatiellia bacterium]|nr:TlyA family RNA methyltransferase [Kiritimatiellia bacterium]HRZ11177.1 TlyA family RNA methyltransferase [Kiritimatiellia bacterium]HSA19028.1 TlyA family RNA methyltransferase [Kiritimatiellia bacterium]
MKKIRLDQRMTDLGLAESREKAQRLILAGEVTVDGQVRDKPAFEVGEAAAVAVKTPERFASRGGEKLEAAFLHFRLDVGGLVCLDVGASTGGFTDCLLQRGAAKVYAVDVGHGQLHWRLRQDPRVVVMEGTNARFLYPANFSEPPAFATADVAFISLTLILPAIVRVLAGGGKIVTLIKPQFEAGREQVGRGGVVRDPAVHAEVIERIRAFGTGELGLSWKGWIPSPLTGPAGNVEFLALWEKGNP